MNRNDDRDHDVSFDGLVDLGSVPPPPGVVGPDVHAARTAVAALPSTLLEELRRARMNEGEAQRTRKQEKFDLPSRALRRSSPSFANEAPTAPGKDGQRLLRPIAPDAEDVPPAASSENLVAAIEAALEAPPSPRPPSPLPVAPPPAAEPPARLSPEPQALAAIVKTPPMATPAPPLPPPFIATMTPASVYPEPEEKREPSVRLPFLVAFLVVTSLGLLFVAIAIAERMHHR